jgi:hypothetical protein
MLKNFYVASSFKNIELVSIVAERLKENGFIHTYDWTKNNGRSTINQLMDIG